MAPLAVTISNKMRKLLAGTDYNFSCLAQGHSPSVEFRCDDDDDDNDDDDDEFRWFLGDVNIAHSSFTQVQVTSIKAATLPLFN